MASSENPFAFGHYVEGDFFTDRTEDAKRLLSNLTHGINTILISPRRWGKSSLVKVAMDELMQEDEQVRKPLKCVPGN